MSLFGWLFGRKQQETQQQNKKYRFTDEDRDLSAEIRQKRRDIELMKLDQEYQLWSLRQKEQQLRLQASIKEAEEKLLDDDYEEYEDDGSYGDFQMVRMLKPAIDAIASKINPASSPSSAASSMQSAPLVPAAEKENISNEQLKEIWDKTPIAAKNFAKRIGSNEALKALVRQQMPGVDDDTLTRAVAIIRA